ncbi:MAG: purine-nucleoside phosphorylase [Mogibacterium sp.]|nr:purine-nucleoside phosphorylase [Mogibacterium sp.]
MDVIQKSIDQCERLRSDIRETAGFLRDKGVTDPEIGIILGTGLNDYADSIEDAIVIPYDEIPNMYAGSVDSHRGQLVYGSRKGKKVLVMAGRFHFYENNSIEMTAFPTRVMVELGIKRLIITNASGSINPEHEAGHLMLISDHINFSGANPLIGRNLDEYGTRFPDLTYVYDKGLRDKLKEKAADAGIKLYEGVYIMVTGPSFETPAEIRAFGVLGADAVGMSSVPEAIIAAHARLEVIGISALANKAAGLSGRPLTNDEVTEMGMLMRDDFIRVVDMAVEI